MVIGGVVLPALYTPIDCTYPRPERNIGIMPTYTGVAIFDWGSMLPGKVISLKWTSMTKALFDQLDIIYQGGGTIEWNSGINNKSYMVAMTTLDGSLLFDANMNSVYMLGITMSLVIVSLIS